MRPEQLRGRYCVEAESNDACREEPAALSAAFRASDAAAAAIAAEHLLPMVRRLVQRLAGWEGDADDLVQDVLVTAIASRKQFTGGSKLETWVTRIAINCCRAHRRKQWVRTRLFGAWAARRDENQSSVPSSEGAVIEREQAELVRAAVAKLPAKNREAIVLCYLENMTVAEAADAIGVRRGTVEVRLVRARKQLRELLEAVGGAGGMSRVRAAQRNAP